METTIMGDIGFRVEGLLPFPKVWKVIWGFKISKNLGLRKFGNPK